MLYERELINVYVRLYVIVLLVLLMEVVDMLRFSLFLMYVVKVSE